MRQYPWYQDVWKELFDHLERLPHAIIIHGQDDSVCDDFAQSLCDALLCQDRLKDNACRSCENCLWTKNKTHPDFFSVDAEGSEATEKLIPVDIIRTLKSFFELTSHQAKGKKVAYIAQAHRMNRQAANALLKIVEEPPNDCVIILSTSKLDAIIPTVKSRSRLLHLHKPSKQDALDYLGTLNHDLDDSALAFFSNSPVTAVNERETYDQAKAIVRALSDGKLLSPDAVKSQWLDYGLPWLVTVMQKWSYDLFLYKLTKEITYFPAEKMVLEKLASQSSLSNMLIFQKKLNELKAYASKPVNKEINMDVMMMEYRKIFH